jgi:hypothetical protein
MESHTLGAGWAKESASMRLSPVEAALFAACIVMSIVVVYWGLKILTAWSTTSAILSGSKPRPYPNGWHPSPHATAAEIAAAGDILELTREEYEKLQKTTIVIDGVEYGKRSYIRRPADRLSGPPHPFTSNDQLKAFLVGAGRSVPRRRVRNTVYYNVTQFSKAWQKRLRGSRQAEKLRKDSWRDSGLDSLSPHKKKPPVHVV